MIKTQKECLVYQDTNQVFTVEVVVDETNQTKTIKSLTGPGISGAVSADRTNDFLALMNYIYSDLS